jgi:hypothetical protein
MTELDDVIAAGIDWLLHVKQPAGCHVSHLGTAIVVGDLRIGFVPRALDGSNLPIVTVEKDTYTNGAHDRLIPDDVRRTHAAILAAGVGVDKAWWHIHDGRSFRLDELADPSLLIAVENRDGKNPPIGLQLPPVDADNLR